MKNPLAHLGKTGLVLKTPLVSHVKTEQALKTLFVNQAGNGRVLKNPGMSRADRAGAEELRREPQHPLPSA